MRLALDLSALTAGDTGVAWYANALRVQLQNRHPEITVLPFAVGRGLHARDIEMRRIRVPLRLARPVWRRIKWPLIEDIVRRPDLLHVIDGVPPATRLPVVLTVHDALPLTVPELYGRKWLTVSRAHLNEARRADVVITTCESTAMDIARVAGISRERIVVAPPGHRPPSIVAPESAVPPPFILAVGAITPRKGFDVLADAAARIGGDCPPVVIAGPDGWRADQVRSRVKELGIEGRVHFLGRVGDRELEGLYRAATVMCHPSVAEGFGIPCLEAMGFGTPVVAADIPSIREIGGDGVELVPVSDADALAHTLLRLLSDDRERDALADRGLRRSQAFTWENMADRVVDAYRMALR
jgi:glycosyltransferase involved in cell wall biosynthesis